VVVCAGYIFFGSAIAISDKLVAAAQAMLAEDAATMTGARHIARVATLLAELTSDLARQQIIHPGCL